MIPKNNIFAEEWFNQLRDHQDHSISASENEARGIIVVPTGGGKTRIQIALIVKEMLRLEDDGEVGVFGMASPGLTLNHQLLEEAIGVLAGMGMRFDTVSISSDKISVDSIYKKYRKLGLNRNTFNHTNTLIKSDIQGATTRAHSLGRHILFISTYKSLARTTAFSKIDLLCCDEAHKTTGQEASNALSDISHIANRILFFTATPRAEGAIGGMNNFEMYGDILYNVPPKDLVEAGEMLRPKIHIIDTLKKRDYNNSGMISLAVREGHINHSARMKERSVEPDKINGKILVCCQNIKQMRDIILSQEMLSYQKNYNTAVAMISSQDCFWNGIKMRRIEVMQNIRKTKDNQGLIVFHVNTLGEGIDIPSFTGCMLLKDMGKSRLIQTNGRAARLNVEDREKIYSGLLSPSAFEAFIKANSEMIIPIFCDVDRAGPNIKNILATYYTDFGCRPEIVYASDLFKGDKPDDLPSILDEDKNKKTNKSDLKGSISDLLDDVEFGYDWQKCQSDDDRINLIKNLAK